MANTLVRRIPQYPDYAVSACGRVFRWRPIGYWRELKTPARYNGGYPTFTAVTNGQRRNVNVHIVVAQLWIGPRPQGLQVCHVDDNKQNPHVNNLEYGTPGYNTRQAWATGLATNLAKLTLESAAYIRAVKPETAQAIRQIAKQFGVKSRTVRDVLSGHTWRMASAKN